MKEKKCPHLLPDARERLSPLMCEVGCPLDHCRCGTHDAEQEHHKCPPPLSPEQGEMQERVHAAEAAAGWDPNP